jgi:predicted DNA-binding transcriptional regulator AlpA
MDNPEPTAAEAQTNQPLLTPSEAAAYLGVTTKALENWRGTGTGPSFIRLSARCVRYAREDLEAHIWGSRRRSTADAG